MNLRLHRVSAEPASTPSSPAKTMTLRDAFEQHWWPVNQYLVAASTAQKYRTALDHWDAFLAKRDSSTRTVALHEPTKPPPACPVSSIDAVMLNEFGVWLMADDPPRKPMRQSTVTETAKKVHAILRAVGPRDAKHQHSPQWIDSVPVMAPARRLAGGIAEETKSGRNLTDDELDRLHDACGVAAWPDESPSLQWRTYIVFTSMIAARAGDASSLPASAITLDADIPLPGSSLTHAPGWVAFEADKTEKRHLAPLPSCVSAHLRCWLKRRGRHVTTPGLYQWTSYRQRPWQRQWKAIAAQAGLPSVTSKDLRTTANNRWNAVRDGLGDWLLGHSAKGVNDRHYRDRLPDAIAAAAIIDVPASFAASPDDAATQAFLF